MDSNRDMYNTAGQIPITVGTDVFDANGEKVGTVKQYNPQASYMVLEKGMLFKKDLYVPGLNFVFGVGHAGLRCGAYSLTRYEIEDPTVFTRRSLKLLSHEAGHIISINHCTTYACVMQGANSLPEDDSHPMHLCPIDLQKVLWNSGMDRRQRYEKLLLLYAEWNLPGEATWVGLKLK